VTRQSLFVLEHIKVGELVVVTSARSVLVGVMANVVVCTGVDVAAKVDVVPGAGVDVIAGAAVVVCDGVDVFLGAVVVCAGVPLTLTSAQFQNSSPHNPAPQQAFAQVAQGWP